MKARTTVDNCISVRKALQPRVYKTLLYIVVTITDGKKDDLQVQNFLTPSLPDCF